MDRIEQLEMAYKSYLESDPDIEGKVSSVENGKFFFIPSFEGSARVKAIYAIYIKRDYAEAKEFFYKAARVAEYMSVTFDRRIIDSGIYQISYALLSDNKDLIQRYSTLKNSINDTVNIGFQLPNAVQNILLNNQDELAHNIRNLERLVQVPRFKWWVNTVDVLNGFLSGSKDQIETGLQLMLKTHKKRNTDPLICKFFSIDTSGLCKLAWIKGYEIDLNSELVPVELMPVEPLSTYEDYEFLH
ncbi:MAG: immunity 49 family protein [Sphingobacteriaceae bacterium]|nr:immunity 49 family protein [Sphingobacteriaceae bacterium]